MGLFDKVKKVFKKGTPVTEVVKSSTSSNIRVGTKVGPQQEQKQTIVIGPSGPMSADPQGTPWNSHPNYPSRGGGGGGSGSAGDSGQPTSSSARISEQPISTSTPTRGAVDPNRLRASDDKTKIYYSSNREWIPEDKKGVVVYTDKTGKTTGTTSRKGFGVEKGFDVSGRYFTGDIGGTTALGTSLLTGAIGKGFTLPKEKQFQVLGLGVTPYGQESYVDVYRGGNKTYATISKGAAFKESFGILASRFGIGERKPFGTILDPWSKTVKPVAGREAFVSPIGEVIDTSKLSGRQKDILVGKGFKKTTYGQAAFEIETPIRTKFEKQLETGVKMEDIQPQFKAEVTKAFKKSGIPKDLGRRRAPIQEVVSLAGLFPVVAPITLALETQKAPRVITDSGTIGIKPTLGMGIAAGAIGLGVVGGISSKLRPIEESMAYESVGALSKQPISYGSIIKGDRISLSGTRSYGKVTEEIDIAGKLIKTKDGTKFLPTGRGSSIITGELDYNLLSSTGKGTKIVAGAEFDVGAKAFEIGSKGQVSTILTKTGTIPRVQTGALFEMPSTMKEAGKTGQSLSKQLVKNVELGGTTTVSLDTSIQAGIGRDVYLSVTPKQGGGVKSLGLTKILPKTKPISMGGLRGGITKTPLSKTFSAPKVSEIKTPFSSSTPVVKFTKTMGTTGSGVKPVIVSDVKQISFTGIKPQTFSRSISKSVTRTRTGSKLFSGLGTIPKMGSALSPVSKVKSRQGMGLISGTVQVVNFATPTNQTSKLFIPVVSGFVNPLVGSPRPPRPKSPKVPFVIPKLGAGLNNAPGTKKILGDSLSGISTSFTGYAFGITKAQKKGIFGKTGFEIRPLSKEGDVIFKVKKRKKKKKK